MSSELNVESTAKRNVLSELGSESPIENEIASYRAIHPLAVLAFICGVIGIFSFTSAIFLIAAVASVVIGFFAISKIQKAPDVYAGAILAKLGLALGLICGLSSITMDVSWKWRAKKEAEKFAKKYGEVLQSGSLKDALWYRLDPGNRSRTDADTFLDSVQSQSTSGEPSSYDSMVGPINQVFRVVKDSGVGVKVEFEEVETAGFQDLESYALVRMIIKPGAPAAHTDEPKTEKKDADGKAAEEDHGHDHAAGEPHNSEPSFMLLRMKALINSGKFDWWVTDIEYPYNSGSAQMSTKIDHGHSHGS